MYKLKPESKNLILDLGPKQILFSSDIQEIQADKFFIPDQCSLDYLIAFNNYSGQKKLNFNLAGNYAQAHILGYVKASHQHILNLTTTICHQSPHTQGSCLIKGLLDDQASIILHGLIQVLPSASDSHDQLTEKLLILHPLSFGELKPELEILNHNVTATHATTISSLDNDQLWYLQTRGLSLSQSKQFLATAFLNEIIEKISQTKLPQSFLKKIALE